MVKKTGGKEIFGQRKTQIRSLILLILCSFWPLDLILLLSDFLKYNICTTPLKVARCEKMIALYLYGTISICQCTTRLSLNLLLSQNVLEELIYHAHVYTVWTNNV